MDAIAVVNRGLQRLQHQDRRALAADVAVRPGIAELAAPVGRHHAALGIGDMDMRGENDVDAAGERQIGLSGPQALDGQMHGGKR